MAEDYKIQLGVALDTSDLRTEINKIDGKEKIKLGVDLKVNDIRDRITAYNKNANNVKLKLGVKLDTDDLKKQINSLNLGGTGTGKGVAIPVNIQSLESSLNEVKGIISSIQSSIGNIGDGSEMKPLLSSVNQIADALGKVGSETQNVISVLNALGKKDFSVNLGVNVGGSNNPIARNAAYGNKVRSETLPQLKQQAESLVKYVNDYYKTSYNELEALQKLVHGTKLGTGDFYQSFLFGEDSVASRMSGGSLAGQMQAFKQYIDMFKQAASLKGLNLDSVTSQFDSPEKLIKAAQDIQTGANEAEKGVEKLKGIFGASIDADALSAQLTPIVEKLEEIKASIQSLSQGISIDGLTQSFDRLSETLEKLVSNFKLVQSSVGEGLSNAGTGISSGIPNIVQEFKEIDIAVSSSEEQINHLKAALNKVGFNDSSIEGIANEFKELGITVKNVTSRLNDDGSVRLTIKGLDQYKNEITKIKDIGKDGLTIGGSTTISRDAKEIEESFVRLKSLANDIGNLKIDIFKSDDADEIRRMSVELDKLQAEYKELHAQTSSGLSSGQEAQLNNSFKKSEEALSKLRKSYAEARVELAKDIKSNIGSSITRDIHKVHSDFDGLANKTDKLKQSINLLDDIKIDLDTAKEENDIEALISSYEKYKQILKEVQAQIDIQKRTERDSNRSDDLEISKQNALLRLKTLFGDNSEAARKFASEVERLQRELNECGNSDSLRGLNKQIDNLGKKVKESGAKTQTFGQSLKKQFSQYSSYLSVASLFMYAEQALRDMFEQVKLIDSAMTELKKVTNETNSAYNQFLTNAASRAKEIGTTIDGLVESTADFARLGYSFKESQGLAEVANIYAVVGDDIDGVEGATQSLVSTMAAFKSEMNDISDSDFALGIVDKFNEVSNNFAISSGGIGEAMQRSASSLMAANNTIDESIALITAANTVVQDPAQVGRLMPTIKVAISVKSQRWSRPRKDFISIFDIYQLGRIYVFLHEQISLRRWFIAVKRSIKWIFYKM